MGDKDQFIMLVSSDWFEGYLAKMLPSVKPRLIEKIKMAARAAVHHLMNNNEIYWNVSFSKERLYETEKMFLSTLEKYSLSDKCIMKLQEIMEECTGENEKESAQLWLFWMVTIEISNQNNVRNILPLDDENKKMLIDAISEIERVCEREIVKKSATESATEWDIYLRGLTPDLPLSLLDFALENCIQKQKFRAFWEDVSAKLRATEKKALLDWYLDRAKMRASPGFDVSAPSWM